jgi:hypothetical protein
MVFSCCKSNKSVIQTTEVPQDYSGFVISEENNESQVIKELSTESQDSCNTIDTDDVLSQYIRYSSQAAAPQKSESFKNSQSNDFQIQNRTGSVSNTASFDSTDDDITTVYEEPMKAEHFHRQVSFQGSVTSVVKSMHSSVKSRVQSVKNIVLPSEDEKQDLYVKVPNFLQRGYVSETYEAVDLVKQAPYVKGAPVWYLCNGDHTFKWYIPATIKDYVIDKKEVTGYVLTVDCKDEEMEASEEFITQKLKNAKPVYTMLRWNEKMPECPTNRKKSILNGNHDFTHVQQEGYESEYWGVTLEQIKEIKEHKRYKKSMSFYDVVKKIIKPQTKGKGVGYALMKNQKNPQKARVMVCHSWKDNFDEFCSVLEKKKEEGPFWIYAFAMNLNTEATETPSINQDDDYHNPATHALLNVLNTCKHVLAVVTDSADMYSRLWCLYEMYLATALGVPIIYASSSEEDVFSSYKKPIRSLDASCSDQKDKEMIHSKIRNVGGFFLIDDTVIWAQIKSLIGDIKTCAAVEKNASKFHRPIGSCSVSNAVARQNARIAAAIHTWQKLKDSRNPVDELQIVRVDSMTAEFTVPATARPGDEIEFPYNDVLRKVKVPNGENGKRIRVKLRSQEEVDEEMGDPSILCGMNCY